MTHWNYRMIRGEDGVAFIAEVYFDADKPVGYSDGSAPAVSDFDDEAAAAEDIRLQLRRMIDATNKPMMKPEDFK
jgi:hypothetical protein